MRKFIGENLSYPDAAKEEGIEGTVVVRIAIDFKGKVTGSEILSGIGYGCDEEAQRVAELLQFDVENHMRRGKVLFHKRLNIHFGLPQKQKETPKETAGTQISYQVIPSDQKGVEPEKGQKVYRYTISLPDNKE